jgi:hypothetical protein
MKKVIFNALIIGILGASFILPIMAIFFIGWYSLFLTPLPVVIFHLCAFLIDNEVKIIANLKAQLQDWSNSQTYYNS